MERSFSVDDLVGGLYRLGQAGMGRTDSEAAFQEFLKRIPSASNLAAANASASAAEAGLGINASGSFNAISEAGTLGGGVPRVPSLDLLAKIVMQGAAAPQTSSAPILIKSEAAGGGAAGEGAFARALVWVRCRQLSSVACTADAALKWDALMMSFRALDGAC